MKRYDLITPEGTREIYYFQTVLQEDMWKIS